jgi:3-hydroxybutyryl-CoA dehydrogenase
MLPTLDQVQTIGIIVAGTMGHGIAHVAALSGTQVHLYDAARGAAQAGLAKITKNLEKGVELGNVRPADRDVALARIRVFDELTPTWVRVDCVIEAVPEVLDLEREIFGVDQDRITSRAARDQHLIASGR